MDAPPSVPSGTDTTQLPSCVCAPGVRGLRYIRHLYGSAGGPGGCAQPMLMGCVSCGGQLVLPCRSRDERKCVPCADRFRRDLARVAGSVPGGHVYLLTLTAPGTGEHSRWVPKGSRLPEVDQRDGTRPGWDVRQACDCWDHGSDLAAWNASAGRRWNHLLTLLGREYGRVDFFRTVEIQKRGALHLHVIVSSDLALNVRVVQALALRVGFGCVVDLQRVRLLSRVGQYISKYVTKGVTGRAEVPWAAPILDAETGEIRTLRTRARYRVYSQSHGWGITLRRYRQDLRERHERARERAAAHPEGTETLIACAGDGDALPPSPG